MTKQDAIEIFGSQANIARALDMTRSNISQWPDELLQRQSDLVLGAACRLGVWIPARFFGPRSPTAEQARSDADEAVKYADALARAERERDAVVVK